ncbi:hypothetical protein [Nocardia mangyaensis]|uniref:WXG100-like domain-containing protein n=1 Tax=Nocardia mangyaensis TaxID=2213200 RepID=UPI00267716D2|nr:hypothetical protein [Nocardia mangyaensis]MDO3650543.1 hypothetical protein [Nocardia mangyaensis]
MDLTFGAYYSVGNACFGLADALHTAFTTETGTLNNCDGMAGTDEEGQSWAVDYDTRVSELLTLVAALGEGVQRLGRVAVHCGHELALADYNSIVNPVSGPPALPPMPTVERRFYGAPCKAGADLQGGLRDAVDDVIGLANKVGIAIPDGDTDQLQTAAEAWDRLQNNYSAHFEAVLTKAATLMDSCDAEDARAIAEKLRGLQMVVDDVLAACGELSAMCTEFKDALWALRRQMLWAILEELALKVAERFVLAAAGSFLTFGVSAVIGAAAIAETVIDYARKIADKVKDWRRLRAQAKADRKQRDLGESKRRADEAKNLDDDSPTGEGGGKPKKTPQELDDLGQQIGSEVALVPRGSGQLDTLVAKVNALELSQDEAVAVTKKATETGLGGTGGVANLPDGTKMILPTYITLGKSFVVKPDGSVEKYEGDLTQFVQYIPT